MSRKFLDDNVIIKAVRAFLPAATPATVYDPGHMFQDMVDGTIFVNEGTRAGSNFGHKYVNRVDLLEQFLQAPGLAADLDPAAFGTQALIRSYTGANKQFAIAGTNAVDTASVLTAGGGVKFTTTTASADQVIAIPGPAINSVEVSQFNLGALTTAKPIFETVIKTDAAVTLQTIWAGLKLTNTSVSATDANQAFFRFQDVATLAAGLGQFQCVTGVSATNTTQLSGVTVALSTTYHLKITVDANRVPRYYINGVLVATGPALTTAITLKPYVGIQTGTTAAKALEVRAIRLSKAIG